MPTLTRPIIRATSPRPATSVAGDPVPRAVAIVGLFAVAAIHFAQVVPTIEQTPYLGAAFVGLTVACTALAGWLLTSDSRAVWLQVAAINALAIGGYVFTRTFSTFLDNQDVSNWSEMLGLVALLLEGSLVLLSLQQILDRAVRPSDTTPNANRT